MSRQHKCVHCGWTPAYRNPRVSGDVSFPTTCEGCDRPFQSESFAAPQHPSACSFAEVKKIVEEQSRQCPTFAIDGGRAACDAILARLSALKPNGGGDDARDGLRELYRDYVRLLEAGRDRIRELGGDCDPVEKMERMDVALIRVRRILGITLPSPNAVQEKAP